MNLKLHGMAILIEGIIWTFGKIMQNVKPEAMKLAVPGRGSNQPILIKQWTSEPPTTLILSKEARRALTIEWPSSFDQDQIRNREGPETSSNIRGQYPV